MLLAWDPTYSSPAEQSPESGDFRTCTCCEEPYRDDDPDSPSERQPLCRWCAVRERLYDRLDAARDDEKDAWLQRTGGGK